MISLYINGSKVDLSDSNLIIYNYQASEATNPTAIKNAYSQQVSIPHTPNNDKIFDHYIRSDHKVSTGFNPMARTPFEIRNGLNEILEKGYLKLDKVTKAAYSVTLYGGLGGYFYALMYNDDGSKKTLADMNWWNGSSWMGKDDNIDIDASSVRSNWDALDEDYGVNEGHFYTWVPVYGGYPDNFDAAKAYYKPSQASTASPAYADCYTSKTDGGKTYGPKNTNGGILIELPTEQTEMEMQEFRVDNLPMAWKVQSFFYSLMNNAANKMGFNISVVDNDFFSGDESYSYYRFKTWVTLPARSHGTATLEDVFEGTESPADYLIGFAKLFGLMFVYDGASNTVTFTDRNGYYASHAATKIDLSGAVAEEKGKTVVPLLAETRWLEFKTEMIGEAAESYAENYGEVYGSVKVDTGYPFNGDTKDVMDVPFKGAADSLEQSAMFRVYDTAAGSQRYRIKQRLLGDVKWKLYNTTGGDTTELECQPTTDFIVSNAHNYGSQDFKDFFSKVQFHDSSNKGIDGSNVILFYNGMIQTPKGRQTGRYWDANFYVTDQNNEMLELNGGKPCWDMTCRTTDKINQIPQFVRTSGGSLEFGAPKAYYNGQSFEPEDAMYERMWMDWITERYNRDVRKLTVFVNFDRVRVGGVKVKVGNDLLRYFFTYDGALWVLNSIKNYALGGNTPAECEFIKVLNESNYKYGQNYGDL